MTSASYTLLEYLKANPEYTGFTSDELAERAGTSHGATSGFIHRLVELGVLSRLGRRGKRHVYHAEPALYADVTVKKAESAGGTRGRTMNRGPNVKLDPLETQRTLVDLLFQALEIADTPPSLASYSTDDLIAELRRRVPGA